MVSRDTVGLFAERGLDSYAVTRLNGGGLFFEGGHEPLFLQRLRAQLEDERPHLGHPRFGEGGGVVEGLGGAFGGVRQELAGRLDPEGDAVEGLGDGVVQFAGELLALFEGGLAASLGEEPGVLDGHGGLVGDGPQEHLLVLAGLLFGEKAEEDRAQSPVPGDERQAVHDVPRRLANIAMDGRVQWIGEQEIPEVAHEDGTAAAECFEAGGLHPGPVGLPEACGIALGEAV